jgi:hypothetical protein
MSNNNNEGEGEEEDVWGSEADGRYTNNYNKTNLNIIYNAEQLETQMLKQKG